MFETIHEILILKSESPSIIEGIKLLVSKHIDGQLLEPMRQEMQSVIKDSIF